jgi:hypothetical protein
VTDVAGGTPTLAMIDLLTIVAQGGTGGYDSNIGLGGNGGNAFDGGLYVGGGSLTLNNDTASGNQATEGNPDSNRARSAIPRWRKIQQGEERGPIFPSRPAVSVESGGSPTPLSAPGATRSFSFDVNCPVADSVLTPDGNPS